MNQERLYQVLLGPHISEKATIIADASQQVVFRVAKDATKPEIKEAVEKLFNVSVKRVNVRSDVRKAYVCLADGSEIDFLGE